MSPASPHPRHLLHGRRRGHALKPAAQRRMAELLPRLGVSAEGRLDARTLFGDTRPLELEIGFGRGDLLAARAAAQPARGFLGCEPYENGVAALLGEAESRGLGNLRVWPGNGFDMLERLAPASVERVWLLHPDPWPKARHARRRFVNPPGIAAVRRVLAAGGEWRIATDHPLYLRHVLAVIQHEPRFAWTAETADDWQRVPPDWPDTRFAARARALGHEVWRLIFRAV